MTTWYVELDDEIKQGFRNNYSANSMYFYNQRRAMMVAQPENKLKGLCKDCVHNESCKDAKRHLNMIECNQYSV